MWTGSEDELAQCLDTLAECLELAEDGQMIWDQPAPIIDPAVEVAALTALPLVQRTSALLDWVGPSRPVTSTRALKLAVVPEVRGVTFRDHYCWASRLGCQACRLDPCAGRRRGVEGLR